MQSIAERDSIGAERSARVRAQLGQARDHLREWLLEDALPLWSTRGVDSGNGGFEERLSSDATPTHEARRARVQPRQIFAFVGAHRLGWRGEAQGIVDRGLNNFVQHYRRSDGLYRTLAAPDGTSLDETVWLYDQAFALLGFASAHRLCNASGDMEASALELLERIGCALQRDEGGFDSGLPQRLPLQSNPHMHLLEAALEWQQLSNRSNWWELTERLTRLAIDHFIDPQSGFIRETFGADWSPGPSLRGRLIEPGHQFEWAWLLLRVPGPLAGEIRSSALQLIDLAEKTGIRHGVALDALLDDGTVHRATARLWPQTERLRAHAFAAQLTGNARHWLLAYESAQVLLRYLNATVPGLWHDSLQTDGRFIIEPAPAGNLYHVVGAMLALDEALAATDVHQTGAA